MLSLIVIGLILSLVFGMAAWSSITILGSIYDGTIKRTRNSR
jgi:hypothetical protein